MFPTSLGIEQFWETSSQDLSVHWENGWTHETRVLLAKENIDFSICLGPSPPKSPSGTNLQRKYFRTNSNHR